MGKAFDIIEYMSGLTTLTVDESVLKRIAYDRGVIDFEYYEQLTERDKDLILADILYSVYVSGKNIPSFQHQHGQFSTSTGSQNIDKESIYDTMVSLYKKWGDSRIETIPSSSLKWIEESDI